MNNSIITTTRRALLLAIFLFGLLGGGQNARAQTKDTLWTRDVWPLKIQNAVFSPDDKFIYMTSTDPFYVVKYDLLGNKIWENDTLGGIRKFSEDGRFFWNYYGDKYDAVTFQKLFLFGGGGYNIQGWNFEINEQSKIGIACSYGKETQTKNRVYFDSNLIAFNLSDMKILKFTSYPSKIFGFSKSTIHPSGKEVAFLVGSLAYKEDGIYPYTDTLRIEIWQLPDLIKEKEIQIQMPTQSTPLKLKYSPDGSILGYQHDSKLTLYSAIDYSVVWESGDRDILNFNWSYDMKYLYYTTGIFGLQKLDYIKKSVFYIYPNVNDSKFITLDRNNNYILASHGKDWLCILNNLFNSVNDLFNYYNLSNINVQNNNEIIILSLDASAQISIKVKIIDTVGRNHSELKEFKLNQGSNNLQLDISRLLSGMYFLNMTIDNHTQNIKFVIAR